MSTIRDARVRLGLSQKEVAYQAGIDARTLRKIENGEHVSDVSRMAVERIVGAAAKPQPKRKSRFNSVKIVDYSKTALLLMTVSALAGFFYMSGSGTYGVDSFVKLCVLYCLLITTPSLLIAYHDHSNTRIDISRPLSHSGEINQNLENAKAWLGREDIKIGPVTFQDERFKFSIFANIDFSEYARLAERLTGFGVDAKISST